MAQAFQELLVWQRAMEMTVAIYRGYALVPAR
jgi:hypothetical protein